MSMYSEWEDAIDKAPEAPSGHGGSVSWFVYHDTISGMPWVAISRKLHGEPKEEVIMDIQEVRDLAQQWAESGVV